MRKIIAHLLFASASLVVATQSPAQLVLNEFSQGEGGSREYIELVVTGTRTCRDSTADLRGWVIDDQNGWYGGLEMGISTGHFRFKDTALWESVPFGSIILIYNGEEKNGSIQHTDDPIDEDKDNVYILPHHSEYLEVHKSEPASPSSPRFSYPATGFSAPKLVDWSLRAGLNNDGDAIIIVNPAERHKASFSLYYGAVPQSPFQAPSISLVQKIGAGQNCALQNGAFSDPGSWKMGQAPQDETPGAANTRENAAWIHSMQRSPSPIAAVHLYVCLPEGEAYVVEGNELTVPGIYPFFYSTATGCDSTVYLHLSSPKTITKTLTGCEKIVFAGITFTVSGEYRDTVRNSLNTCDSIYHNTYIKIFNPPQLIVSADTTVCRGAQVLLKAAVQGAVVFWTTYPPGPAIRVRPYQTSTYEAIARDSNECIDTAWVMVSVVKLDLTLSPATNSIQPGDEVTIQTRANLPYQVVSWSPLAVFPDQQATRQVVIPPRSLEIEVVAKTAEGCTDMARTTVTILPGGIYVPTAFTPNGDGKNDQLYVFAPATKSFHFSVYNRWGERIFTSDHPDTSWDGKYKNVFQPAGTYVYLLTAVLRDNTIVSRKGTVTLLY